MAEEKPQRAGNRRLWVYAGIAVVIAVAIWLGYNEMMRRSYVVRLPQLPDLSGEPPALVEHLRSADQAARHRAQSADAIGKLGMAYQSDVYYDQAIQCYLLADEINPRDWRWKYYLAIIHEELGQLDETANALSKVLALKPDFAPAWFRVAEAEFKQGNSDAAAEAYRRVIDTDKGYPAGAEKWEQPRSTPTFAMFAWYGLARIAHQRGDIPAARAALEAVTEAAPRFAPAHRLLGQLYKELGMTREAEECSHRARELGAYSPPLDPAFVPLLKESHSGTFLLKHKEVSIRGLEPPRSLYLAQRAYDVNPDDYDVVSSLAIVYVGHLRPDLAMPYIERSIELAKDKFAAIAMVADEINKAGGYDVALGLYIRALEYEPTNYGIHSNMGGIYFRQDNIKRALEHYRIALEDKPDFSLGHFNLAQALVREGKVDEAIEHYEESLRLLPNDPLVHRILGATLAKQGKFEQAIANFRAALTVQRDDAEARYNLAMALNELGKADEAVAEYGEALRIKPHYSEAHNNLGSLLARTGKPEEALKHYREAIRHAPENLIAANNLARVLATHPDEKIRDGREAVRVAEGLCQATEPGIPEYLDTLATAYAEAGNFEGAIKVAERALQLVQAAGRRDAALEYLNRLDLYRMHKPYREEPR